MSDRNKGNPLQMKRTRKKIVNMGTYHTHPNAEREKGVGIEMAITIGVTSSSDRKETRVPSETGLRLSESEKTGP